MVPLSDAVRQPGDEVPATGFYKFVNLWGTECGEILLRKGETFPVIHPHREYRFFLRLEPQVASIEVVLRIAA
jgi:hypothetical protein